MQWSTGGWFGAQLGGSVWMLLAAVLLIDVNAAVALTVAGVFAVFNLVGWYLWRANPLTAYRSVQILVVAASVAGLLVVALLHMSNTWGELTRYGGSSVTPGLMYWLIVALAAGLLLLFHVRFGSGRTNR